MRSIVGPRTREAQGLPYYRGTPHSMETRVSRMFSRIVGNPERVRNGTEITCPSSSHPVDSNIAWFFQSRFQPFVGRVVSQLKIRKKPSTTVAPFSNIGPRVTVFGNLANTRKNSDQGTGPAVATSLQTAADIRGRPCQFTPEFGICFSQRHL